MKYAFILIALLLAGCETNPVLTNVVNAPVRISCASKVPDFPEMLTPCKADDPLDKCFLSYEVDHTVLLGYTAKLINLIKACN